MFCSREPIRMVLFRYHAVGPDGKPQTGNLRAADRDKLIEQLKANGLTPVNIEVLPDGAAAATKEAGAKGHKKELSLNRAISPKELTVFTRQLATTLNAGLPLIRIVHVIHRESSNPRLARMLEGVGQALQKGKSFSQALEEYPQYFDTMYINMVKVGERSGSLPECVIRLADLMERDMTLRRKIRSAMTYPIFVLVFTCLVTWAMMAFLMPKLTPTFEGSGLNIPRDYPLTQYLMEASKFATSWERMGLLVVLLAALMAGMKAFARTPKGRWVFDYCKLNAPFLRGFVLNVVAARFSRSFSLLLQSGIPLVDALTLVARSSGNEEVSRKLGRSAREIGEGQGITATLRTTEVFPDMLIQMSAMGEEAGSLPEMMERVADYYDEEVDTSTDAMTSLLEPCMMVLIGGIVMIFIMGVLPPILGISAGVQEQM
jgi:type IV pilus assembly protein PilC